MLHQDLRFPRIAFFSSRDIFTGQELGWDRVCLLSRCTWLHYDFIAHNLVARYQGIYGRICILFLLTHFPPVCFMITDFFLSLTGLITAIVSGTSRASTSPVSAAQRSANIRRRPSRWSRAGWPVWKSVLKRPVKPDSLCWDTRDETLCLMHTCTVLKRVLAYDYHREGCVCIIKCWQDTGNCKMAQRPKVQHTQMPFQNTSRKWHSNSRLSFLLGSGGKM